MEQNTIDGNALNKGIKIKNKITKQMFGTNGIFTRLFTILDIYILVIIITVQSVLLNFSILKYNEFMYYYYLFFVYDFISIVIIVWSIMIAKKYFEIQDMAETEDYYSGNLDCNPQNSPGKNFLYCKLPKKFGVLPFIYICWLIYTIGLISKILTIYITQVPNSMLIQNFKIGPQILQMSIALTSIVFLVFMEAHRNSENEFHKNLTKSWTDNLIQHTVFEIFDSITFLDLVMPSLDHHDNHAVINNIRKNSPWLEYFIICLASANFLLPSISLYHLSKLSSCIKDSCSSINLEGLSRNIFIHLVRLISVNIAYLIIRIHLSTSFDKAITIFIIKNFLYIIMSIRSLTIEIFEYVDEKKKINEKKKNESSFEMKPTTCSGDHERLSQRYDTTLPDEDTFDKQI